MWKRKRPEGTRVERVPGYRQMMPYLMKTKNESHVYIKYTIDMENAASQECLAVSAACQSESRMGIPKPAATNQRQDSVCGRISRWRLFPGEPVLPHLHRNR